MGVMGKGVCSYSYCNGGASPHTCTGNTIGCPTLGQTRERRRRRLLAKQEETDMVKEWFTVCKIVTECQMYSDAVRTQETCLIVHDDGCYF